MRRFLAGSLLALLAGSAQGQEIESAYTELKTERDCAIFSGPGDDESGDWQNLVCSGYKGYPIFIYYADARESLLYGFPFPGDLAPAWESFIGFNSTGPIVEWRIMKDGTREIPFATIHRWFVTDETDEQIEVLVVEKVGQIGVWDGCAVATGNEGANEKARRIADGQAYDFACGADQPVIDAGDISMPEFSNG